MNSKAVNRLLGKQDITEVRQGSFQCLECGFTVAPGRSRCRDRLLCPRCMAWYVFDDRAWVLHSVLSKTAKRS